MSTNSDALSGGRVLARASSLAWWLLALSVTLNLAGAGAYLYQRGRLDGGQFAGHIARQDNPLDRLVLPDPLRGRVDQLRQRAVQMQRAAQRELRPLNEAMWSEIEKPNGDRQRIAALVEEITHQRGVLVQKQTEAFVDWLADVDEADRSMIVAAVRGRFEQFLRPPAAPLPAAAAPSPSPTTTETRP